MGATSNFSGLLNLSTYVRDYCPLQLYWEGGFRRKELIKYIKPMVKQGSYKIIFVEKTMSMYYKDRFLQNILDLDLFDEEKKGIVKAILRYKKLRTFGNIE